ncbi:TIGR02594 family protein [Caballeronia cordobensis]|uniref:TIGR02594 family protein n=1 Tax=Caballeronia cordobensis TaxID=1353886 RepID=UPI0039B8A043
MQVAEKEFRASIRRGGGVISDQHIAEYFSATSLHESAARLAKEAYCAAFVNWCLTQAGFKGNNSASAASLATWGKPTRDKKPAFGAVAVVRFPGGGHHVTFVSGHAAGKPSRIATLGGNQGKSHNVSHSAVPASWIVAYRLPSNYVESDKDYELHTVNTDGSTMSAASTH